MTRSNPLPALALLVLLAPGCALNGGRLAVLEENDVFNLGDGLAIDRDYSQGTAAAFTMTDEDTPRWAKDAAAALPIFGGGSTVHLGLVLGQEIYTPEQTFRSGLIPDDRPYAGWLYAGLALQGRVLDGDAERRRDRADTLELDVGVVGQASLAEISQNRFHEFFDIHEVEGWKNGLANEPGLLLSWERRWRLLRGDMGGGWAAEALPGIRARAGSVRVDGTGGVLARVGWNLPRDFGPSLVDATGLVRGAAPPGPWISFFGSADARGVAWNEFLDGNVLRESHHVTSTILVHDSGLGLSGGWGSFSAEFAERWRSPEFRERRRYHQFTSIMVSWTWWF